MSENTKALLAAIVIALVAISSFFAGSVYSQLKTREQLFLTCLFAQQTTPVVAAVHICSTLQGNQ